MTGEPRRFLPRRVPIDAYGAGGFRFGDMSHRGSLLCLPSGMAAWPAASLAEMTEAALDPVFAEADGIDLLLLGTGRDPAALPEPLRRRIREAGMSLDAMATGPAAMTWNILLGEGRRVAAALLAT